MAVTCNFPDPPRTAVHGTRESAVLAGATLAGLGLAVGLILNRPAAALAGFALLGAGLSLVVPSVFSASARLP
jgi:hypothetical protein